MGCFGDADGVMSILLDGVWAEAHLWTRGGITGEKERNCGRNGGSAWRTMGLFRALESSMLVMPVGERSLCSDEEDSPSG